MDMPIVVTFRLTREETVDVIRRNMLGRKMILLVLVLLAYMGVSPLATYFLKHAENPAYAFPGSGLGYMAACFGVILYLVWLAPILAARKIPASARDREQTYRFSEEQADLPGKVLDWKDGLRVRESGRYFFLHQDPKTMHVIPRRAFASAADLDAFRDLVARKLRRS